MTADRYELVVAPTARRQLAEQRPESAAFAAYEFITGPLIDNPHRVGKQLRHPLHDRHSARRGTYRVIYRIDEEQLTIAVVGVFPAQTPTAAEHAWITNSRCGHRGAVVGVRPPGYPRGMRIVGFEPCFRVTDVDRAVAHYRILGFDTSYHDETYAFAHRDGLTIHLAHDDDPTHREGTLYIHVDDADDLAREWRTAGVDVVGPEDVDYGKHEGSHVDPDGNVIRFGSPVGNG